MKDSADFEVMGAIGKGGSGRVYKVRAKADNNIYAIKHIEIDHLTAEQLKLIRSEINMLRSLSHNNIVGFHGMRETPSVFQIVMEFAECGSLRHFYQNKGKLSSQEAAFSLAQLVRGLEYLHAQGFAHRDLKCANCLVFSSGIVKLADFGASKRIENISVISGLKGTPQWMSPEVIRGTQGSTGWILADIWSLGCTAAEMLTGQLPFAEFANPMTAMYRIASGETPTLDHEVVEDEAARNFVAICCKVDPQQRPTALELLSLPWLISAASSPYPARLFNVDTEDAVIMSARGQPMAKVPEEHEEEEEEEEARSVSTAASVPATTPPLPKSAKKTAKKVYETDIIETIPVESNTADPQYDSDDFEAIADNQGDYDEDDDHFYDHDEDQNLTHNPPSKGPSHHHHHHHHQQQQQEEQEQCDSPKVASPVTDSNDSTPVKYIAGDRLSSSVQDIRNSESSVLDWSKLQIGSQKSNPNQHVVMVGSKNRLTDASKSLRAQSAGTAPSLAQSGKALQPLKKLRRRVEVQARSQPLSQRNRVQPAQPRSGGRQVSTAPAPFPAAEEQLLIQVSPIELTFLSSGNNQQQPIQQQQQQKTAKAAKLRRRVITNNQGGPTKSSGGVVEIGSNHKIIIAAEQRRQVPPQKQQQQQISR